MATLTHATPGLGRYSRKRLPNLLPTVTPTTHVPQQMLACLYGLEEERFLACRLPHLEKAPPNQAGSTLGGQTSCDWTGKAELVTEQRGDRAGTVAVP